jgi:hypothetical protein
LQSIKESSLSPKNYVTKTVAGVNQSINQLLEICFSDSKNEASQVTFAIY